MPDRSSGDATVAVVAAEAVLGALYRCAAERAADFQIKWPNDILIDGRKVAGILCEQCVGGPPSQPPVLIIGVGVNVDFDAAQLGDDLRRPATTLSAALGRQIAVDDVIAAVAEALVEAMTRFKFTGPGEHSALRSSRDS